MLPYEKLTSFQRELLKLLVKEWWENAIKRMKLGDKINTVIDKKNFFIRQINKFPSNFSHRLSDCQKGFLFLKRLSISFY